MWPMLLVITAVAAMEVYPFGINLGPTYITAAQITTTEEIILASITGSEQYRKYMSAARKLHGNPDDTTLYIKESRNPEVADAKAIFVEALNAIKSAAQKVSNYPVEITSISHPEYVDTSPLYQAMTEIEKNDAPPPPGRVRYSVRNIWQSARLAYGFNRCESFGLNSTCWEDEPYILIVFVDYHQDYIELSVGDVTELGLVTEGFVRLELEDNMLKEKENSQGIFETEVNATAIIEKLKAFTAEFFSKPDIYNPGRPANAINRVKAIMISGEGSDSERFTLPQVRDIVANIFPTLEEKIRDSIDPHYVAAVGSAQWARWQVEDSRFLNIGRGTDEQQPVDYYAEHGEL